jgi:hypothetical protein
MSDFSNSIRFLAKRPGFTIVAILTMAIGIGAATAAFTVVDQILLKPLPFPEADRLVSVWSTVPAWRSDPIFQKVWDHFTLSYAQYEQLQSRSHAFETLSVFSSQQGSIVAAEPRRVVLARAPESFFSLLSVRPSHGRLFSMEDEAENRPVLLISHKTWQQEFGGDTNVLGRQLVVELYGMRTPFTIIGILPPNFDFLSMTTS